MTYASALLAASLAATTLVAADPASAQVLKLGQLNCGVASGAGFIVGSSKALDCTFSQIDGTKEKYAGKIDKFGVDIGFTGKQVILWTVVMAESRDYERGALAGKYRGVSAGATILLGLGGNALIGGGDNSIGLQPVSVATSTGVNVAAGFASVTLIAGD